jgi:hypothetical protein
MGYSVPQLDSVIYGLLVPASPKLVSLQGSHRSERLPNLYCLYRVSPTVRTVEERGCPRETERQRSRAKSGRVRVCIINKGVADIFGVNCRYS